MPSDNRSEDEARIRLLVADRQKAVASKDLDAALTHHARDVVIYDVVNPLRYNGADAVRERIGTWFGTFDGAIGYEPRDLSVTVGSDAAFCHYVYRVSGSTTDGSQIDMWVRATLCFRKVDGAWLVTHEHDSVPFDPATGRASLDLNPD